MPIKPTQNNTGVYTNMKKRKIIRTGDLVKYYEPLSDGGQEERIGLAIETLGELKWRNKLYRGWNNLPDDSWCVYVAGIDKTFVVSRAELEVVERRTNA